MQILARVQNTGNHFIGAVIVILVFIIAEHLLFRFLEWWRVFVISALTIWLIFSAAKKALYFLGAILTVLGSFLPWWCIGDVIVYCTTGINFYNDYLIAYLHTVGFFNGYFSLNNIGLIAVFLSIFTVWLANYPPKIISRPKILAILSSVVLVLFTIYQLITHFALRMANVRTTSGVWLEYGFVMVLLGSLLLLTATLRDNRLKGVSNFLRWLIVVAILVLPFSFLLEPFYYEFIYHR